MCGGTGRTVSSIHTLNGLSPRVRGNPSGPLEPGAGSGSIPTCAGEPRRRCTRIPGRRVYPRVCGGTFWCVRRSTGMVGLSPRVRGNHCRPAGVHRLRGSIPACAGEPHRPATRAGVEQVYPRVCGGTNPYRIPPASPWGLSPRVRGNRRCSGLLARATGSIPACAGEPPAACAWSAAARVYPRVCGGTGAGAGLRGRGRGLSPRVRGNPLAA